MAGSRRSGINRGLAWLVIDLCLLFSVLSIWLAWGVLYPRVDELGPNDRFDAIVVLSGEVRRIERGLELAEEGRAPVLVISYGEQWASISDRCGTNEGYRIFCPEPPEDSTRGEARLIGDLITANDWTSVVIVTGDYHVMRARLLTRRCVTGSVDVAFGEVDWDDLASSVIRQEVLKFIDARVLQQSC